ncbi:MAG: HlyD family efflux transporter periplasmic adaptor subunit [Gammaproteobacteria bacterium]|nr:HlyD family efflux transporter periplasmic adaptor subunit [Gammaproteobacteria bacterium]MYF52483.1 HlyD family efflux transporter periplasmic adaptor subunit [Gammaproteobacteria bacterium]MYK44582.1 HlyD family efflux transporter periplasmic adaptor subunit [Gammaproteobacteria bacterium]
MNKSYIKKFKFTSLVCANIFGLLLASLFVSTVTAKEYITIEKQDTVIELSASGIVDSEDFISIGAPPNTRWRANIAQIVEEGKRVRKGELLVRFEGGRTDEHIRDLQAQITELEGRMESQKEQLLQEYEQEKLDLASMKSDAERATRKAAIPADVFPGIEYQKLVEEKRLATILYQRALHRKTLNDKSREKRDLWQEKNLTRNQTRLAGSQEILSSYTVRSPRAGIAVVGTDWGGQKLVAGSDVSVGFTVVKVVDDTKLLIRAFVPENVAAKINVGQSVTILSEATGSSELTGRVFSVGNTVRRKSKNSQEMVRDFTVKLDDDYSEVLKIGVSVQLTVEVDHIANAIAIPKEALIYREGAPGVFKQNSWVPIILGAASQDVFIVESGIEVGDKVRL